MKPRDPVCGMFVDPSSPLRLEHQSKTYFFCNPKCLHKFEIEPARYLAEDRRAQLKSKSSKEGLYTCPMHPLIQQRGFGFCPECGMDLEPADVTQPSAEDPSLRLFERRFYIAVVFSVPVLALSMLNLPISVRVNAVIQFVLTLPVLLFCGAPFFVRAWSATRHGKINMFSLIALGTGVAFVFSAVNLLTGFDLASGFYFESTDVILALALLGQILELRSRAKTGEALRALLRLTPPQALKVFDDGREESVAVESLSEGDLFRVRPGETIATDGVVLEGESRVEESLLTGEAKPVAKGPGASVTGGTQNDHGRLLVRALRVGSETVLAQIVRLVSEAQRTRAPIQHLADRFTAYFVPGVLFVALLSGALWMNFGPDPRLHFAISAAISVLIIACPCALGLATPISMMVATARGAKEGLLIRTTESLERLSKVSVLALDKTGTLTEGKISLRPGAESRALGLAASLERHSEHPLAQAFLNGAKARQLPLLEVESFMAYPGRGVGGVIAGQTYRLGNEALMKETGVTALFENKIYLSEGTNLLAEFEVEDALKPDAYPALNLLRKSGLEIVILSGDHPAAVDKIARRLGVTNFHGSLTPAEKADFIKKMRASGSGAIAFAGDGVNDAPALAVADVGLAFASGADVAKNTAAVTLMQNDLHAIVRARALAQQTMQNIRQNLFFAFVYNSVGILVAAGALYPLFKISFSPMVASVAMSLSSVSVIANALRLRRRELQTEAVTPGISGVECCD